MYLVDANILLYATDEDSEHHAAARDWLDERTAGAPRSVGLPWPSLLAFFRLVTNPRIYSPPATAADAWQRIEDWLSRPAAWIPVPGSRHQQVLGGIVRECRPAGNLVPDAHLAALALEHGLTVVSTDTDFARFPGVAWLNPVDDPRAVAGEHVVEGRGGLAVAIADQELQLAGTRPDPYAG
jgi:uncharacterized protein